MWDKEEILYHLNYMLQCLTLKEAGALKSVIVMIEARNFRYAVNTDNMDISLRFDFGPTTKNRLIITYMPGSDSFRLSFLQNDGLRSKTYKLVRELTDVYFDEMKSCFEQITGLETHAPKIFMTTPNISLIHVGDRT